MHNYFLLTTLIYITEIKFSKGTYSPGMFTCSSIALLVPISAILETTKVFESSRVHSWVPKELP